MNTDERLLSSRSSCRRPRLRMLPREAREKRLSETFRACALDEDRA
jgi:hypothetical protein